jgi:hypothetical protein
MDIRLIKEYAVGGGVAVSFDVSLSTNSVTVFESSAIVLLSSTTPALAISATFALCRISTTESWLFLQHVQTKVWLQAAYQTEIELLLIS